MSIEHVELSRIVVDRISRIAHDSGNRARQKTTASHALREEIKHFISCCNDMGIDLPKYNMVLSIHPDGAALAEELIDLFWNEAVHKPQDAEALVYLWGMRQINDTNSNSDNVNHLILDLGFKDQITCNYEEQVALMQKKLDALAQAHVKQFSNLDARHMLCGIDDSASKVLLGYLLDNRLPATKGNRGHRT